MTLHKIVAKQPAKGVLKMYIGNRMSVGAVEAYEAGEKPLSRWTKSELLDYLPMAIYDQAKKLTADELKDELLSISSWHHTGKYFNQTNFYSIDDEAVDRLTSDHINEIISSRKVKKARKTKEKPLFVTAKIKYIEWEGRFKNYQRPVAHTAIVKYMSNAKMVTIDGWHHKRLASVEILAKIEQKTKFADGKRLLKKGGKQI